MRNLSITWMLFVPVSAAWLIVPPRPACTPLLSWSLSALPENYQEVGEELIEKAAVLCGLDPEQQLDIEWKSSAPQRREGKIIVTVQESGYLSDMTSDDEFYDEDDEGFDDDNYDDDWSSLELELDEEDEGPGGSVDVVELAKTINAALDADDVGQAIAETHSIDVTTPGASDELTTNAMFQAYQGFDVICQYQEVPKKRKTQPKKGTSGQEQPATQGPLLKTLEGRLHNRDDMHTTINLKGRLKKISNDQIVSVKLPKAKKEKR